MSRLDRSEHRTPLVRVDIDVDVHAHVRVRVHTERVGFWAPLPRVCFRRQIIVGMSPTVWVLYCYIARNNTRIYHAPPPLGCPSISNGKRPKEKK